MAEHDTRFGEALGARDADIILRQGLEHRRPRGARDEPERGRCEHRGRQHQVRRGVAQRLPVTGQDAVDQQQARHLWRQERNRIDTPRTRRDLEHAVEHRQHDEGQPECRCGNADQRHEARDVIDPAVALHRSQGCRAECRRTPTAGMRSSRARWWQVQSRGCRRAPAAARRWKCRSPHARGP